MNTPMTRMIEILNSCGRPVFGLVFWGSVGGALLHAAFPELPLTTGQAIAGALGLAAGLRARKLQRWI